MSRPFLFTACFCLFSLVLLVLACVLLFFFISSLLAGIPDYVAMCRGLWILLGAGVCAYIAKVSRPCRGSRSGEDKPR